MRINKKISILAVMILLIGALPGCRNEEKNDDEKDEISVTENGITAAESVLSENADDMFSNRDYKAEYDESECVRITLSKNSASCEEKGVEIDENRIRITDEGTYILSGVLEDGMIVVDADETDKIQLVLDGVDISCDTSAPIYILQADKVFITLPEKSENYVSASGTFEEIDDNNIDGAIFSKSDLTFNGSGTLNVKSVSGHGIVCKDDLVIMGGSYKIDAAYHGMDANDSVRIADGEITIVSGKDGIHVDNSDDVTKGYVYVADGTFDITAGGDGISASSYMWIEDGDFDILAGGGSKNGEEHETDMMGNPMGGNPMGNNPMGENPMGDNPDIKPGMDTDDNMHSMTTDTDTDSDTAASTKGIKASGELKIDGGIFNIDSADDAVHSNSSIYVYGGSFTIATGDDGMHADDTLNIQGGKIDISESYEGLEGLHVYISAGDISIVSTDDGINAAGGTDSSGFGGPGGNDMFGGSSDGSIEISGGNIYINASGDGIDANGYLDIAGGYIEVCGPTVGDTATLDFDTEGTISGGTFIGTGASGMAQTFDESEQGVFAVSVGNTSAGTEICIYDTEGNLLLSHTPELDFEVVIFSNPDIQKGETYKITVNGVSGEFEAY